MKKSLFLLMSVCISAGFSACAVDNNEHPSKLTASDEQKLRDIFAHPYQSDAVPRFINSRPFYFHKDLPPQNPYDKDCRTAIYFSGANNGYPGTHNDYRDFSKVRYVKVVWRKSCYQTSVEYCDKDGVEVYGSVFTDDGNTMLEPSLPHVEGGDIVNNDDSNSKFSASILIRKPLIIVTVSAVTASAAYAITKFINKQWKKEHNEYNAKKIAAFTGIGAGIMTGIYLYWPTSTEEEAIVVQ